MMASESPASASPQSPQPYAIYDVATADALEHDVGLVAQATGRDVLSAKNLLEAADGDVNVAVLLHLEGQDVSVVAEVERPDPEVGYRRWLLS